jgi:hypothetical protein
MSNVAIGSPGLTGRWCRYGCRSNPHPSVHAGIAVVVVEDVVANAGEIRRGTRVGHCFVEVRALPRMRQVEGVSVMVDMPT